MRTSHKGLLGGAGLALGAALFMALNGLGAGLLKGARVDLTEQGLYTLSRGTRNILAAIEEPIRLRFYFTRGLTEQVPEVLAHAQRVQELLEEYTLAADGGLVLEVIDPAPFSEEEDEAVGAGVQGIPLPGSGDVFTLGLVATNSTGESAVIPFFDPGQDAFLEYELSRFLSQLSRGERGKVALLSALPVAGSEPPMFPGAPPAKPPYYLLSLLEEAFEVETLETEVEEIPADVDVLLLIHPKALGEPTLYAVDQFVLRGGRALVMVDPHSEEDAPPSDPGNPLSGMGAPRSSDLSPLLAAWGVEFDPDQILADRSAALYVTAGAQGRPERTPYVAWVDLSGDCLDETDPVTSGLGSLRLAAAGVLRPLAGAATTFTSLVQSTEDACELPSSTIQFFPQPKELLASFAPAGQRYTLAARVTGPVDTAFPDGPPPGHSARIEPPDEADEAEGGGDTADDSGPDDDGAGDETPDDGTDPAGDEDGAADAAASTPALPASHLARSSAPIHVLVLADADMAADSWWVQFQNFFGTRLPSPTSSNADFVLNALDSLAGSTDLLDVRGRGRSERPFDRMEELRRAAEQRYLAEEQSLQEALRETETRLTELESQREDGASMLLTPEQAAEIERFQEERLATRKELRAVKHELGKDIESLKDTLMLANTLGVPLVVLLAALGAWWSRGRKGGQRS